MDLVTLGYNMAAVAAIIMLTKILLSIIDPKKTRKRLYPLVPFILASIPAVLLTKPLALANWQAFAWQWVSIGSVSAWIYKTGKTTILGK